MVPLRTRVAFLWVGTAAACTFTGCDRPRPPAPPPAAAAADPAARPPQDPNTKVPRPDPARMGYDADTQTLLLYDLEDPAGRWLLHLPGQTKGVPVNTIHQFMDEVDLDRVGVSYTTGTGAASPRVTLRDVLTARELQASR